MYWVMYRVYVLVSKRLPTTMAIMAPPNLLIMAILLLLLPIIAMLTGLLHIIKTMLFPLQCLL